MTMTADTRPEDLAERSASWLSHLEALNTIIAEIASSQDTARLVRLTLEQVLAVLRLEMGAIWVMGYQVIQNLPAEVVGSLRAMTHTANAVTVENWDEESPRYGQKVQRIFLSTGIQSTAIVPILSDGRVIGRLVLLSKLVRRWDPEEILFLQLVGKQLGVLADRVRLSRPLTAERSNLRGASDQLIQLSEGLNRASTVEDVLAAIGHGSQALSGADGLAILIPSPERGLRSSWSKNLPAELLEAIRIHLQASPDLWQAESARPHLVPDAAHADSKPDLEGQSTPFRLGAFGYWPLATSQRATGVLACFYQKPHRWSDFEQEALVAFSRQASIALENAYLLQKHELRAQQLSTLNEISRSLTSMLELEPLLNKILESAVDILNCEAGSLLLADEKADELVFQATVGPVAQNLIGRRIPLNAGLAGKAVETRQTFIVNDVRQSKEWFHQTDEQTGFITQALLVVPLQVKDHVIGVIEVINKQNREPFSQDDEALIAALASQAAIALDNARLFVAERRRRQELESLRQASLQLTSSLDIRQVLEAILDHTLKLVTADEAHIYLYHDDNLTTGASRWPGGEHRKRVEPPPQRTGFIYTVAHRGQSVVIPDVTHSAFYSDLPVEGAVLGLPLRKGEQVRGVMEISFNQPHSFDDDELRVLQLLADQAAVALENASLYEALQEKLRELSDLSRASAAMRDAETLKEMGPLLANHAAQLVNADSALIYLMDSDRQHLSPVGTWGLSTHQHDLELSLDNTLIGQAIRTGSLHYLSGKDSVPLAIRDGIPDDLRPAMCIPIRTTRGQIVGAILVARKTSSQDQETEFNQAEQRLLKTLAEIAGNALLRARSHEEMENAYIQTVLALANAVDARDTYTSDHSHRISILAEATALEMNCSPEELQAIHWSALLHDIGKIGVPDEVLSKPGPLTEEEWDIMRKHPEIGANIIAPLNRFAHVSPIIRSHQERYDGLGYPRGLKGDEIPLPARILAVVDAYSAIIDDRVYRQARDHEQAIAEIKRCSGSQFDPEVVAAFLRIVERPWSG